jgi:hypothetical protein
LDPKFVEGLCKEYDGTISYEGYIKELYKRAEVAINRQFAVNPTNYYCRMVDKIEGDINVKLILRSSITEIAIGVDFGGNKSGYSFVATAKPELIDYVYWNSPNWCWDEVSRRRLSRNIPELMFVQLLRTASNRQISVSSHFRYKIEPPYTERYVRWF